MVIDAEFIQLSSIYFNFKIIIPIFLSKMIQAFSKSRLDLFFETDEVQIQANQTFARLSVKKGWLSLIVLSYFLSLYGNCCASSVRYVAVYQKFNGLEYVACQSRSLSFELFLRVLYRLNFINYRVE